MAPVIVLGAGPTGLMAAWDLALAGHEVVLLESSARVGGMSGSIEVGGVRVDLGSHRLHPVTDPSLLTRLRSLPGVAVQERPRNGRILLGGRLVRFPLQPADLVRSLPIGLGLRLVAGSFLPSRDRHATDTFDADVRRRLGSAMADAFYGPYVEKLWGRPATALHGDLARRRVSAQGGLDLVRKALRRRPGPGRTFLYPSTGFGALWEAMADAAVEAGVDLRLSTPVTSVVAPDTGPPVVNGIEAATVLSTIPLATLATVTTPAPPPGPDLVHRGLVLLYLVLDRRPYTTFDAHYFPGPEVSIARLSEPANYRTNPHDPADRTVLCAEWPCAEGDDVWQADPSALAATLSDELVAAGLPVPQPVAVEAVRLPRVYPVIDDVAMARLADLEDWVGGRPGLVTLGRQGLFAPDNSHHVLEMGAAAAACVGADGTFDASRWSSARESFRSNVVED